LVFAFSHPLPSSYYSSITMSGDTEPIVKIRELKKDRVNFVLENVDMA
jgi:hypothetical protein